MLDENTIVHGYKATDAEIKCRGFQFEVGKWHEIEGDKEIKLCEHGFHFCEQPSGPWCYYSDAGTRIWKVEAKGVLEAPKQPGADYKLVAKWIRLVEEVVIGGHRNTGDSNTGDRNTGDRNTGDSNTGYCNTGDRNTGYCNTGHRNTGHRNTGNYNTGDRNTGDYNTGYGNATNRSAGYFCQVEPTVICFDVDTGLTHDQFQNQFGLIAERLIGKIKDELIELIDFEEFAMLPGITKEKFESLIKKHKGE